MPETEIAADLTLELKHTLNACLSPPVKRGCDKRILEMNPEMKNDWLRCGRSGFGGYFPRGGRRGRGVVELDVEEAMVPDLVSRRHVCAMIVGRVRMFGPTVSVRIPKNSLQVKSHDDDV
jgi:hypothetical protein